MVEAAISILAAEKKIQKYIIHSGAEEPEEPEKEE